MKTATNESESEGKDGIRYTNFTVSMFPSAPCLLEVLSQPFKRSQQGLFHGKMRLSGNNVPFSLKKTRRTWMPNIQQKRLRSETLDQEFKLKVTTRALKTIKKNGGLDNYVKNTRHELLGDEGMRLRLLIKDAAEQKKQERKHVGLHEALSSQKQLDLQSAEDIRKAVGEALGLPGLASSEQTLQYIQKKSQQWGL